MRHFVHGRGRRVHDDAPSPTPCRRTFPPPCRLRCPRRISRTAAPTQGPSSVPSSVRRREPHAVPTPNPSPECPSGESLYKLRLSDTGADGWEGASYQIIDSDGAVAASGTLSDGGASLEYACLPDGDYELEFEQVDDVASAGDDATSDESCARCRRAERWCAYRTTRVWIGRRGRHVFHGSRGRSARRCADPHADARSHLRADAGAHVGPDCRTDARTLERAVGPCRRRSPPRCRRRTRRPCVRVAASRCTSCGSPTAATMGGKARPIVSSARMRASPRAAP